MTDTQRGVIYRWLLANESAWIGWPTSGVLNDKAEAMKRLERLERHRLPLKPHQYDLEDLIMTVGDLVARIRLDRRAAYRRSVENGAW